MGSQKNVPKYEEPKRKIAVSQVNNELPCVLFKETSYTAKKKWLKMGKRK